MHRDYWEYGAADDFSSVRINVSQALFHGLRAYIEKYVSNI
ncbi:hypothetical protein QJV45_17295 [Listeria booriae]|nr:hypothetical protein [Listeria booriae]MDT0112226.1 hypothetical protein [Listeria booriae]